MASLQETHCFRSPCAHPCCWENEQRVRRGLARRVVAPLSHRGKNAHLEGKTTDSISMVTEMAGLPRTHPPLPLQREGGVASRSVRPIQTRVPETVSGPLSPVQWSLGQRLLKLGTGQISLVPGLSSGRTLTWVPRHNYVPQNLHREKPPQVSIKELTWFPPAEQNPSIKKKSKQEEKRKKTVSFQERKEEHLVFTGSGRTVVSYPQVKDGLRLPSAAVIHATQERVWSGPRPRDQPDYQYRLDPKNNLERVDWDSLRRQTYLWRRRRRWHLPPASPAQERWLSLGHGFASGLRPVAKEAPCCHSESPLSTDIFTDPVHSEKMISPSSAPPPCGILHATLPRKPGVRNRSRQVVKFAEMHHGHYDSLADEIPSEVTLPPPPPCSLASD
ncbi:unnamed protein product [Lota lota]